MSSKATRFLAIAAASAALATAAPTTSGAALGPCQVKPLVGVEEWYQDVLVTGESAPRGAIDVRLTCGVVHSGTTEFEVTDPLVGPVAALATPAKVHAGFVYPCYELTVLYIEHTTREDTCP